MEENKNVNESTVVTDSSAQPVVENTTEAIASEVAATSTEPVIQEETATVNVATENPVVSEAVSKDQVVETVPAESPAEQVVETVPVVAPVQDQVVETAPVDPASVEVTAPVQEVVPQAEVVTTEVVTATQSVAEQSSTKPKKKVNKTLIIILIIVVIFGGTMLLMNQDGKAPVNGPVEEEKEKVIYNIGTDWGDKYFTYLMESKSELTTYEVAFIDVDFDDVPEMFVKYIDNTDKEALKIFYIAEDEDVYETKAYRDFRIRFIYSLANKTTNWYLYINSSQHYGTYTMLSKIIDEMAFDADIKATNDSLLIQYGKQYYDTDYQPVFYNIKSNNQEGDFKDFVGKYSTYKQKVEDEKVKVETKYADYEYKEEVKVEKDSVGLAGRTYKYGNYYGHVIADPDNEIQEHISSLVLNKNGTIIIDGVLETYTVTDKGSIVTASNKVILLVGSGVFKYNNIVYKYEDSNLSDGKIDTSN